MADLVILGTDTGVGKTTFALLWLAWQEGRFDYWKPLETGPSDSRLIAELLPDVVVHPPCQRFADAVAPLLAARRAGQTILSPEAILQARPTTTPDRHLLIETFGSPFSPLDETRLQVEFIRLLAAPMVLIANTTLGAIGRTVACCRALRGEGLPPAAIVLLGDADPFAVEQIEKATSGIPVMSLAAPTAWTTAGIQEAAAGQGPVFARLFDHVFVDREGIKAAPATLSPAADWIKQDRDLIWHPYTPLQGVEPPLPCVGAEDEFLILADGRKVIDGISSWWTILHGHRHPALMQALRDAAEHIDHVLFAGVTHPFAAALAERLLASLPWNGGRVFYSDNGSTAVEVALKMAYQYWRLQGQPRRTRFVGFRHGYHGDTFGAMAVSRDPIFFSHFEPLLFQADIVPLDPQRLDDHLSRQRGEVAGVILEPLVQGAGGMRMHSETTLRDIFEVTRRHDVLFLADEVMTGGGRTGTLWAFQAAQIAPDLVAAAKTLAGGILPLAATLVSPRIVAAFDHPDRSRTFFHGHSFTAHPLACAVALASWDELDKKVPAVPMQMQRFWQQALDGLKDQPGIKDVRIRGMIAAVEIDVPGGYLANVGRTMGRVALEHGVLLRPLGNVLYVLPPFCTSEASLRQIAQAMTGAVSELTLPTGHR